MSSWQMQDIARICQANWQGPDLRPDSYGRQA